MGENLLEGGHLEDKGGIKKGLRRIGYQYGRWFELAQDCIQWWVLVLVVLLNLEVVSL